MWPGLTGADGRRPRLLTWLLLGDLVSSQEGCSTGALMMQVIHRRKRLEAREQRRSRQCEDMSPFVEPCTGSATTDHLCSSCVHLWIRLSNIMVSLCILMLRMSVWPVGGPGCWLSPSMAAILQAHPHVAQADIQAPLSSPCGPKPALAWEPAPLAARPGSACAFSRGCPQ